MAMFLTIKAGAVVTWTNTDDEPRTVLSDCGQFRSAVETDESITFTFENDRDRRRRVAASRHKSLTRTRE
jgi:plastocyanin